MSPLTLDAFKKMIVETSEDHFYPGDRVRMMRSPFTSMLGREYEVVRHAEKGVLTCRSYKGSMEFQVYSYQMHLVHRPVLNKLRALFSASPV
ncbi:MAG: hypothetical protein WAU70_06660 [Flavobacteriales bacterium]